MKPPSPEGNLAEEDRRALRGSKFAPLPTPPHNAASPQPRIAHPGGPMTTNKAAALAKFLERKLQQPDGLKSLNSKLVELAVKNAKDTVLASKGLASTSDVTVRHVTSFEDSMASEDDEDMEETRKEKMKRKKDSEDGSEIEEKKQKKRKGRKKKTKKKKTR